MKTIPYLLFILICCACSVEPKEVQTKETVEKQTSEIQHNEIDSKPDNLQIHSTKYRIVPVDETSQDKSLQVFVSKLKDIVKRKDLNGLLNCLDTGIAVSWGGGEYGIDIFKTNNGLNFEPRKSEFWKTLNEYISMGGAWDNKEKSRFCFPYHQSNIFYQRLNHDLDCYSMVTCTESEVIVYNNASITSKKLGILSYEVLTAVNVSNDFTKIQTIDQSITGYIQTKQLFRCYNAHPVLEKINGEWKIVSFAPYD